MKKELKELEGFKTQTEQELHDIMGGQVAASAAFSGIMLYGVGITTIDLWKKLFS